MKNRILRLRDNLYNSDINQADHELLFFISELENNTEVKSILDKLLNETNVLEQFQYFAPDGRLHRNKSIDKVNLNSKQEQAALLYRLLKLKSNTDITAPILAKFLCGNGNVSEQFRKYVTAYIDPLINFIHESLIENNNVFYLLNRYKQRVEWFTKDNLLLTYSNVKNRQYEQILEDDLRKYLFDGGIEYPFSTPKLSKGKADVVGQIESKNPLIVEIKIVDKDRNYGIERIKDGFRQIEKYTSEFNKNIGYLVVFNIDNEVIEFDFQEENELYPMIEYNGRMFYFLIINLNNIAPSKLGKVESRLITKSILTE